MPRIPIAPAEIDRFSALVDRRLSDMAAVCRTGRPLTKDKTRDVLACLVGLAADVEAFRGSVEAAL